MSHPLPAVAIALALLWPASGPTRRAVVQAPAVCPAHVEVGDPLAVAAAAAAALSCGPTVPGMLTRHGLQVLNRLAHDGRRGSPGTLASVALVDARVAPVVVLATLRQPGKPVPVRILLTMFMRAGGWRVDDVKVVDP